MIVRSSNLLSETKYGTVGVTESSWTVGPAGQSCSTKFKNRMARSLWDWREISSGAENAATAAKLTDRWNGARCRHGPDTSFCHFCRTGNIRMSHGRKQYLVLL